MDAEAMTEVIAVGAGPTGLLPAGDLAAAEQVPVPVFAPQDEVERLLRERALRAGADLRPGIRVRQVSGDGERVGSVPEAGR